MEKFRKIKKAKEIAAESLRACYFGEGILASRNHFSDYWARDSFWALGGILSLGDFQKARDIFELFLRYQKRDGKIPRKIMLEYALFKYLFKKKIKRKKPNPVYTGLVPPFYSMDDNSLLTIAFWKYIHKTGDKKFAAENYEKIKKAVDWYDKKLSGGLVKEYFLSNWMDTVFKSGNVLYTNVLYFQALESLEKLAEFLGKVEDAGFYFGKSLSVKEKINEVFWNGKFYSDQPSRKEVFDIAGNILAVLYNAISGEEATKIIKKIQGIEKNRKLLPTVLPPHPFWKINPITYPLGIADYHNGASWLWIDLLAVWAEYRTGDKEVALENLEKISKIILRDKTVYETYFLDGKIYQKPLWKSAVPFAWNSGIFLEVFERVMQVSNGDKSFK